MAGQTLQKADSATPEELPRGRGLKVHHLRPAPGAHKRKMRVGRGEGSKGKTAGRGTKGSKARKQVPARFEGGQMPLHMRVPKLKGFRNRFRTEYQVVNVATIAELFPDGGQIGVEDLVSAGAVRGKSLVKVLGDGEIAVAVQVTANAVLGLGEAEDRSGRRKRRRRRKDFRDGWSAWQTAPATCFVRCPGRPSPRSRLPAEPRGWLCRSLGRGRAPRWAHGYTGRPSGVDVGTSGRPGLLQSAHRARPTPVRTFMHLR